MLDRLFSRYILTAFVLFLATVSFTEAATLRVSPETGVYTIGNTFTAQVVMNTQGKAVNAADAVLKFNPKELSVVSVNRASSVFNLWTLEPTFSNSAGTISFGGGSPTGYTGGSGNLMTVTFRALQAGTPKVTFTSGSILAADGLGTNVLTAMNGSTYTVDAKADTPPPEYVPPVNTPGAPVVTSSSHPDQMKWYSEKSATLSWTVPSGVTAVRTLLDTNPGTVPTIVYEEAITGRTIDDLPEGTSYFHIQFKNADGWGRASHFRLNVDTEVPRDFSIREEGGSETNPNRTFIFNVTDTSPIVLYKIELNGGDVTEFADTDGSQKYTFQGLKPGSYTMVVEAIDSVGKSKAASYSFTVATFEAPSFTEYPERLSEGVIPALRGTTRSNATVSVTVRDGERTFGTYEVTADTEGVFTVILDGELTKGVYDITAVARDEHGAESAESESIRMIVEEPGYITIGTFVVRVLSVIVPLIALSLLLVFGSWFLWWRLHRWRRTVMRETIEAEERLKLEFDDIVSKLHAKITELKDARKAKLTKSELSLIEDIETDLRAAQGRIRKEITDIEHIVE